MHLNLPRLRLLDWNCLRFTLLWIYEGRPVLMGAPATPIPSGRSETVTVWLLERGRVRLRGEGFDDDIRAPEWMFLPFPGHDHVFSEDARILSVNFAACWPDGRQIFEERMPLRAASAAHPRLEATARRLLRQVRRRFPGVSTALTIQPATLDDYLAIEADLAAWVAAYAEAMVALGCEPIRMEVTDQAMLDAARDLDRQASYTRPAKAELARRAGLSVSQFDRRFVRALGQTPRQYAERRRCEVARQLLTSTAQPVKQIAFSLGFLQPSHFAAWFRRLVGEYPARYRSRRTVEAPSEKNLWKTVAGAQVAGREPSGADVARRPSFPTAAAQCRRRR